MIITNLIQAIKQRVQKQQVERILEPSQLMEDFEQDKEYSNAGKDGSLSIIYELAIHKIVKLVSSSKGKALDLACGSGQLICKIAKSVPQLDFTAVDLSSQMLKIARTNREEYGLNNLCFEKLDIFKITDKFKSKSFDFISWNLAMHHIDTEEEVIQVINSMSKLLKDEGILFIFDIERAKTKQLAKKMSIDYNQAWGKKFEHCSYDSYLAAFTYSEFENILKKSNFNNYEHKDLIIGNWFQYACTKKINNKINRKPNLNHYWQKRDYHFLKFLFRNI